MGKDAISIPTALVGERLDRAVALLWNCSRSAAAELVDSGSVLLNSKTALTRSERLKSGDALEVSDERAHSVLNAAVPLPETDVDFAVVAEDVDFVVIEKPAGLVVHPGAGVRSGTLCSGLLNRYPEMAEVGERTRPGIVHRLDKDTTGLMVAARTAKGYSSLRAQLEARSMRRSYEAVCWGRLEGEGVVDAPIGRSSRHRALRTISEQGRPARTRYRVQQNFSRPEELSRLRCRLETGRTHQIRVHLSAIGNPLVGDFLYGAPGSSATPSRGYASGQAGLPSRVDLYDQTNLSSLPDPASQTSLPDLPDQTSLAGERRGMTPRSFQRPALHSASLAFEHPAHGRLVEFDSDLPQDFRLLLEGLK